MPLQTRNTLKNFFRKGKFPTEVHFADLIDSTVNKIDDGFDKSESYGLQLTPQETSNRLISFFRSRDDQYPRWQMVIHEDGGREGLSLDHTTLADDGKTSRNDSRLFFDQRGQVGIHTTAPRYRLDVDGAVGMQARIGTHRVGQAPADGQWHPILTDLTGLTIFEVVARVDGPRGRGRYAITHAIATGIYGRSKSRIAQTRAYYGWFWNRIELRWKDRWDKDRRSWYYTLEMRTRRHYGTPDDDRPVFPIRYHIASLWDEDGINRQLADAGND